jgi:putative ABC transport system substrate-binding protein
MTTRRELITLLGGAAATWPLAARTEPQGRVRRIGVLVAPAEHDAEGKARVAAFIAGLREWGWIEGRNVRIDVRYCAGDPERIKAHAAELVRLAPDVILANSTQVLMALQRETHTIPIVFAVVADPVENGFVASLARPGGNITGFTSTEDITGSKWPELLKEIDPRLDRLLIVLDPSDPSTHGRLRAIQAAAPSFKLQTTAAQVADIGDIERAISGFARVPNGGMIVLPSLSTISQRGPIATLAARYRLPTIYLYRYFVVSGGLMSYGPDTTDLIRRAGAYADRILKGAKPGNLPVQQPIKFELVINLNAAKALGLDVPWFLQQRADEVIE